MSTVLWEHKRGQPDSCVVLQLMLEWDADLTQSQAWECRHSICVFFFFLLKYRTWAGLH